MAWEVVFCDEFMPEYEALPQGVQRPERGEVKMAKSLKQAINELPARRRKQVKKRADVLIQEQLTLQQLRRELELTQEHMAGLLDVQQGHISKIERRTDMLISTLRDYIEAMGGELELIARLPGRAPVRLGFADAESRR